MIKILLLFSLLIHATIAQKGNQPKKPPPDPAPAPTKKWLTLNGLQPIVVARGGFSGLFPESSEFANKMAIGTSLPEMILYCNLQLTKDGAGICQSDIRLDNSTDIASIYPNKESTYKVNGEEIKGYFAIDFMANDLLSNVSLVQNVYSRPALFDGLLPFSTVEDAAGLKPPGFWLNVPYDLFYVEHKLSVQMYLEKALKKVGIDYISSPEINFLKAMSGKVNRARTKLVFNVREGKETEQTTKQKYESILKNLTMIKSFASGILVPKQYIWPVGSNSYLQNATTLVNDAHKLGLEVFAEVFANDRPTSYNYSYDPTIEYQQFVDNNVFAIDGFVTDFPPTASEAIACFVQNNATKPKKGKPLVISHNGASGVYPGNTDLAYQQAIDDGADIIDCPVQLTKDGVPFCMDTPDLMGKTSAMTSFMSRAKNVPEIQKNNGIFSFDLSWSEINSLKPEMVSPFGNNAGLLRNPAAKSQGKLMKLDEFLEMAKTKAVTGILIEFAHVAFLAKKGLDVVEAVTKALNNASFDKQSTQKVLIQADDSSVLAKFSNVPTYEKVMLLKKEISDAPKEAVEETKKHADSVVVTRRTLISTRDSFTSTYTSVMKEMKAANISVYVSQLRNEFIALAFDFFSDPILELATYVQGLKVDGLITDFPATASKYLRSPCSTNNPKQPYNILPAEPGSLLGLVPGQVLPPASAPAPSLDVKDVVDPPLPPVARGGDADSPSSNPSSNDGGSGNSSPAPSSSGITNVANISVSRVAMMVLALISIQF